MEILGLNPSLFWFIIGFIFLVLEVLTPGIFLMFFGLGAWVLCALLAFLPLAIAWQLVTFVALSIIGLVLFRKKIKSFFEKKLPGENNMPNTVFSSQYIGREVEVLVEISPRQPGRVELNGTLWQAASEEATFKPQERVTVFKIEGLTLWVR